MCYDNLTLKISSHGLLILAGVIFLAEDGLRVQIIVKISLGYKLKYYNNLE